MPSSRGLAEKPIGREAPTQSVSPDRALVVLVTVPSLDIGAADQGAIDLVEILANAGHVPIVVSTGGRHTDEVVRLGGEVVRADTTTRNPFVILRNAAFLNRLVRERGCDIVHAHGRAPAWSAWVAARTAGVPFVTTCTTDFREQNLLKRWYNAVMARGDRVIATSERIGEQLVERHRVPAERLDVIHPAVDLDRFDRGEITPDRIAALRIAWGVRRDTKVILVPGRIIRRNGPHVVVQAAWRLKHKGLKDFLVVFVGEDNARSRYGGELWDLVLASDTADVVRLTGGNPDPLAAYAAATVVVGSAVQLEGLQRDLLEAMAMGRPVVASDLAAGPEAVLAPPAVAEEKMTGLRYPANDDAALAAALIRMLSMPDAAREAIGRRAREWVVTAFDRSTMVERTLAVHEALTTRAKSTGRTGSRRAIGAHETRRGG